VVGQQEHQQHHWPWDMRPGRRDGGVAETLETLLAREVSSLRVALTDRGHGKMKDTGISIGSRLDDEAVAKGVVEEAASCLDGFNGR